DVCEQPLIAKRVLPGYHKGLLNVRKACQNGFDFAHLHQETTDFYPIVFSPKDLYCAVRGDSRVISGLVYSFAASARVAQKYRLCCFGLSPVSQSRVRLLMASSP